MSVQGVQGQVAGFSSEVDGTASVPPANTRAAIPGEQNTVSTFSGQAAGKDAHAGPGFGTNFLGQHTGVTSQQQAAQFDFGAILAKIFDAIGSLFAGAQSKPTDKPAAQPIATTEAKENELSASISGESSQDGARMKGSAHAQGFATTGATSHSFAGVGGVGAVGEVSARLGVDASAEGSIESDFGKISGRVHASAELYARAKAYANANLTGAHAGASAEVGAHTQVDAQVDASAAGGNVTVHGEAKAEAGAGATANAKTDLSYDPLAAAVDAKAGAFAGARAGFKANGGVAGVKYGVAGEVRAGVGIDAEFNAGISDGKLKFSFGFGVSVGVGFSLKFDFEIDLNAIGKAFGDLFGGIAEMFGEKKGDWSHAASTLTQVIGESPEVKKRLNTLSNQFDKETSGASESSSRTTGGGEVDLAAKSGQAKS